jgi:hypothetical protein
MAKFRKKPIVIEAVQVTGTDYNGHRGCDHANGSCTAWDGRPFSDMPHWLSEAIDTGKVKDHNRGGTDYAQWDIETLEGVMTARPDDWIIQGVKGEIYPCKPDIFAATYDPE